MPGLTADGFVTFSIDECKADLESAFRAVFGASIDLTPQSNFGQIIGVLAERFALQWDSQQAVYGAFTPDGAIGAALDQLAGLSGTTRRAAFKSLVNLILTGDNGTTILTGKVASVVGIGTRFVTLADGTLVTAGDYAGNGAAFLYAAGARVWINDGGTNRVYVAIVGGVSGSGTPPTGTGTTVDGAVTWHYAGDGKAAIGVASAAEQTGPKVADAYTITTIATPVAGWKGVTNLLDAALGADVESDASLRIRREQEIRAAGNATPEAIRARLLRVTGVTAASVLVNETDTTDGDGMPPHSIECVVEGSALDADVAAAIFASRAAGIATTGTSTVNVTDSEGNVHAIKFSRPANVNIYITANVSVDASLYPANGDTQIAEQIVAWGDAQKTGKDAVQAAVIANAFKVLGVLDLSNVKIGTAPAPVTSSVAIVKRQLAVYDTGRIALTVTKVTP